MQSSSDIPLLTDLIEKGIEITMSDLGLDDDPIINDDVVTNDVIIEDLVIEDLLNEDSTLPNMYHEPEPVVQQQAAANPFAANPELEQSVRRILDEHMERAWQEIKITIAKQFERS